MKPQSCKNKGRLLQQRVRNDLLKTFVHLSEEDIRSTSMGAAGEDILLSNAARLSIPFSFEAKNQERMNMWEAIHQAKSNTPENVDYAVVFKKNNEQPHIAISWDAFLKLICPKTDKHEYVEELHKLASSLSTIANNLN